MKHLTRRTACLATLVICVLPLFAQAVYFPAGSFDTNKDSDRFVAHWFSGQLIALHEPSLLAMSKDKSAQTYRFLWLRSFHHPVAVRVDFHTDGPAVVMTKIGAGEGGYPPGNLVTDNS